jgi:hypothetical protein
VALAWPQGRKRISITLGGQFATLGANVVIKIVVLMNPHFRIKIHPKPNLIFSPSSSFIFPHFPLLLLSLCACLWLMKGVSIISTWNMAMKNTKVTRICLYVHPWWFDFLSLTSKRRQKWKKKWYQEWTRMNEWKHTRGWSFGPWFLTTLHMNSLAPYIYT